jgi:hypothetical protein
MSILNNSLLLGADAAAGGYEISRSVRLNAPDSAYLSRTPGSAGNRTTWTWAGWVKRCVFNTRHCLFTAGSDGTEIAFESTDILRVYYYSGGAYRGQTQTNGVFRDPSAWYHVVVSIDTTQTGNDNIAKIYVNGVQQSVTHSTNWNTNDSTDVNNTVGHYIGRYSSGSNYYLNGYLADYYLIDGQALDPSSFGEFDTNGVWQPIDASGLTYGTNGFHLPFSDNSTAAALGTDTSGEREHVDR